MQGASLKNLILSKKDTIFYLTTFVSMFLFYGDSDLWFDEAGQYWISKGLNHDSMPQAPDGQLNDVISNNNFYNFDPGGFSILMHFWLKVSESLYWIRLLPFLFFCIGVLVLISTLKDFLSDRMVLVLFPIFIFVIPFSDFAFFVRAHTMEFALSAVTLRLATQLFRKFDLKTYLQMHLIILLLFTTRYDGILVGAIFVVFSLKIALESRSIKSKLIVMSTFNYCVALYLIYFFVTKTQNSGLEPLEYLSYLGLDLEGAFRKRNLAYLFLLIFIFIRVVQRRSLYKWQLQGDIFAFFAISTNFFSIALSVAELSPWDPFSRQNPCLISILLLSALWEIQRFVQNSSFLMKNVKFFLLLTIGMGTFFLSPWSNFGISKAPSNFAKTDVRAFLESPQSTFALNQDKRVLVSEWEAPGVRYILEYDKIGKNFISKYPSNFTFMKTGPHALGANLSEVANDVYIEKYDFVIGSRLVDKVKNLDGWVVIGSNGLIAMKLEGDAP